MCSRFMRLFLALETSFLFSDVILKTLPPKKNFKLASKSEVPLLVSHYSANGDTISCDAPYSVIGFRGKLFLRYPLVRSVFGLRYAICMERSGGVAAIVCDTTGNAVRQGYCYTCLAIRGGGISVGSLSALSIVREFRDQLWLFHGGGPSKKRKGTNRTGGSTILKLIWGGNLPYFPGLRDLQPYETWKFQICSRVFPESFRMLLWEYLTVLRAPPKITS